MHHTLLWLSTRKTALQNISRNQNQTEPYSQIKRQYKRWIIEPAHEKASIETVEKEIEDIALQSRWLAWTGSSNCVSLQTPATMTPAAFIVDA